MGDVLFEIVERRARQFGLDGLPELYQMVMHDAQPKFTDGIFLFMQNEDNEDSSFKAASELIEKDMAAEVLFVHQGGFRGSPGYRHWEERLTRIIGEGRIRPVRAKDPIDINTWTESLDLVTFALEEKNRRSFYLVAPPFHILRAFMIAASVAIRHAPYISFYAHPGAPQDLNKPVRHTGGEIKETRKWWMLEEIKKIVQASFIYTNKSIEPIPAIMDYMRGRKA